MLSICVGPRFSERYNVGMAPYPDDELPPTPKWANALRSFMKQVDESLTPLLGKLLQEKHVYQSVSLDADERLKKLGSGLDEPAMQALRTKAKTWLETSWVIEHFDRSAAPPLNDPLDPKPYVTLQPIEIVCFQCKRRTAHIPITWSEDTKKALERRMVIRAAPKRTLQVLTLVYQCQACHTHPTVFLVSRDGDRFRLDGRSPLEVVEVPKHIPEPECVHFRDAVVANATGKTLAGLFYLRTTIEQFARRTVGITGRATGDEIMAAYGETIPADVRGRLPSLKEWYDRLSIAMHGANGDAALFEEAARQISKHFDIRRALEIA